MSHAVASKGLAWVHVRKINRRAMAHRVIELAALWPGKLPALPNSADVRQITAFLSTMPRRHVEEFMYSSRPK